MKRLLALLPLFALTACVYMENSHEHNKGTEVSKQQAAQVEPGKTDKEWILRNFGTPDRIHAEKDGLEIFEYINERTERSDKKFIFLFSVESDKVVSRQVIRVTMRNNIVESITTNDG